jgi:hypothetical protein
MAVAGIVKKSRLNTIQSKNGNEEKGASVSGPKRTSERQWKKREGISIPCRKRKEKKEENIAPL